MSPIARYRRILNTREQQRDVVQRELSSHIALEQRVQGAISNLKEEKLSAMEHFQSTAGEGVSARELWIRRQAVSLLEGKIEKSEERLIEVKEEIADTQSRLSECHKEVRVMETYVGRLWEKEKNHRAALEQRGLDDFSNSAFLRRKRNDTTQSF